MNTAGAGSRLRALIDDEVSRWSEDFRRGRRDFDLADPDGVAERAHRNLAGYGPLAPLLADDDVWEIMLNAPDQIFVKRHHGPSGYHDEVSTDAERTAVDLRRLVAGFLRMDPDVAIVGESARPRRTPRDSRSPRWFCLVA